MKQGELPGPWVEGKTSERETIRLVNALRAIAAREFHLEFFETTALTAVPATIWTSDDMPANSVWDVEAVVLGMATDGSAGAYRRIGRFVRVGSAASGGAAVTPVADVEDVAAWDAALAASGNGVRLTVTGDAARTVQWSALITVRELKRTP